MVLTIGIEVEILAGPCPTGVERALRLWLEELPRLPDIKVKTFARSREIELPAGVEPVPAASNLPGPLWREFVLPGRIGKSGVDVFLSPVIAFPIRSPVPTVATLHEIPWLEDGCNQTSFREQKRNTLALKKADTILAISAAATRQILTAAVLAGITPGRIRVVRHGFHPLVGTTEPLPTAQRGPLVVTVSAYRPRKNLPAHITAFARAAAKIPAAKYVLVGPKGRDRDELAGLAKKLGVADKVELPGFLSDQAVAKLLSEAAILFHAPLSEGFGFTPLEALSLGCVPLLSRRGALVEVNGDAAIYTDYPRDPTAMGLLLAAALAEPARREKCLAQAPDRLAHRDPGRAARRLAMVCAEAAGKK